MAWISTSDRLPKPEEAGGFGAVEVILQCNPGHKPDEPWQVMRIARPIFIGGDPDRVLWVGAEDKSGTPIENSAWFVTHWRRFPRFPKPIPRPSIL